MKTILLTGASGGIGSATKAALEAQGDSVIAIDRHEADLAKLSDLQRVVAKVGEQSLDWVVFAHGFADPETEFTKESLKNISATLEVNTLSVIQLTQLLLPKLRQGGGIIFISSTAGLVPSGLYAVYSASKAAVNAFAQALARDKPEYVFIALAPGATNTAMRERLAHDAQKHQSPAVVAEAIARIIHGETEYKSGDIVVVKDGVTSLAGRV